MLIWNGSTNEKKSTLECFFSLISSMGYLFGRMEFCMALSIAEVDYVAAFLASCEGVWIQKLLYDLFDLHLEVTCIFCDN